MQFIGNFGYVAVCIVGAYLVTTNAITIETIVAFIIYIRLFTQKPNLLKWEQIYNSTQAASERVFEFLAEKELEAEHPKLAKVEHVKGEIEFKNVQFGYRQWTKTMINDCPCNDKKCAVIDFR